MYCYKNFIDCLEQLKHAKNVSQPNIYHLKDKTKYLN